MQTLQAMSCSQMNWWFFGMLSILPSDLPHGAQAEVLQQIVYSRLSAISQAMSTAPLRLTSSSHNEDDICKLLNYDNTQVLWTLTLIDGQEWQWLHCVFAKSRRSLLSLHHTPPRLPGQTQAALCHGTIHREHVIFRTNTAWESVQ